MGQECPAEAEASQEQTLLMVSAPECGRQVEGGFTLSH